MKDGYEVPKSSKYSSKDYNALDTAQRKYYDTIISMKRAKDKQLPASRLKENYKDELNGLFRAPQVRKDFIERLKGTKSLTGFLDEVKESLGDVIVKREDEDEFGQVKSRNTPLGFDNKRIRVLPVYYTAVLGNMNNLSLDTTSSMIAYSNMSNNFREMSKIVDAADIMRDTILRMEIQVKEGGKPTWNKFKYMGVEVSENDKIVMETSNLLQKFDDYIDAQVYGMTKIDHGEVNILGKQVSVTKGGDLINYAVSLNGMAFNMPAGMVNVFMGDIQRRIEAFAGEFFTGKDLRRARML